MSVRIQIPTPLRAYVDKKSEVEVQGETVRELLAGLTGQYKDLSEHLYAPDGTLRHFVNIYVNEEDIRHLDNEDTKVKKGDVVTIVPSIAGGASLEPSQNSGDAGQPADNIELSAAEILRYSRHLIMPEVGMKGQKKIKAAKVLLVGTGGLGSPAALYLAAAGVGKLGLVDFDVVDESNLQRQVLHGTEGIGKSKLESAKIRLNSINPYVEIQTYETMLSSENAMDIIKDYDIVADGTDNFPTRYLVNDACVLLGKPNVYASIFRFEGQASVFDARVGPCYRCMHPEPPPPGSVPSCAEGGVLGILPGVMGTIQATEVIKLILGIGHSMVGRLLLYDAEGMTFRQLKLRKDPACPVCGPNPTVTKLIDYEEFCGIRGEEADIPEADGIEQMTAKELSAAMDKDPKPFLLDVREPHEVEICRIPGSTLIPLASLAEKLSELPQTGDIVIHCKSGMRSMKAAKQLREAGFARIKNLQGGVLAWSDDVDPSVPKY